MHENSSFIRDSIHSAMKSPVFTNQYSEIFEAWSQFTVMLTWILFIADSVWLSSFLQDQWSSDKTPPNHDNALCGCEIRFQIWTGICHKLDLVIRVSCHLPVIILRCDTQSCHHAADLINTGGHCLNVVYVTESYFPICGHCGLWR